MELLRVTKQELLDLPSFTQESLVGDTTKVDSELRVVLNGGGKVIGIIKQDEIPVPHQDMIQMLDKAIVRFCPSEKSFETNIYLTPDHDRMEVDFYFRTGELIGEEPVDPAFVLVNDCEGGMVMESYGHATGDVWLYGMGDAKAIREKRNRSVAEENIATAINLCFDQWNLISKRYFDMFIAAPLLQTEVNNLVSKMKINKESRDNLSRLTKEAFAEAISISKWKFYKICMFVSSNLVDRPKRSRFNNQVSEALLPSKICYAGEPHPYLEKPEAGVTK